MRTFSWEAHEAPYAPPERSPGYDDGAPRPWLLRLLWAPGTAYLIGTVLWTWNSNVKHADDHILAAATVALVGLLAWAILTLLHLRVHRPARYAVVLDLAVAFMVVFWGWKAAKAVHRNFHDD